MSLTLLLANTLLRAPPPAMWSGSNSDSSKQDIYGFEEFSLPSLPSGEQLILEEADEQPPPRLADADEDTTIAALQQYIDACENEDDAGVGGEVWPAAEILCRFLRDQMAAEMRGARVLELGAGVGACGLYAAGLGASRVLLTDAAYSSNLEEPSSIRSLCARNVKANAHLFADGARVDLMRLVWGGSTLPSMGTYDFIIASDVTYWQTAIGSEEEAHQAVYDLASTLKALLTPSSSTSSSAAAAEDQPDQQPSLPRVILAHEHRSRDHGLPWLKQDSELKSWDDGDEHLVVFSKALEACGLRCHPLLCDRPQCTVRGEFNSWSADLSVVEVGLL